MTPTGLKKGKLFHTILDPMPNPTLHTSKLPYSVVQFYFEGFFSNFFPQKFSVEYGWRGFLVSFRNNWENIISG